MALSDEAWGCGNRLAGLAKEEHGRWMGRGVDDPAGRERIDIMREAARLLKSCAMELRESEPR